MDQQDFIASNKDRDESLIERVRCGNRQGHKTVT